MSLDRFIDLLVTITLVEMMLTIGLSVRVGDVTATVRNWPLLIRTGLANYVLVPLATVGLLVWFRADPLVAAGFLILAACPGAPFAPSVAAVAKGNVAAATGLMVALAASSAIVAPLVLGVLLPMMSGDRPLTIDTPKLLTVLLATQLLPLAVGLAVHEARPTLAARLRTPAARASQVLSLGAALLIVATHARLLADIGLRGFVGMGLLLGLSLAAGWLLAGDGRTMRKTVSLTTALRNVGVGLAIVVGSFAGTAAVTAVVAYFFVEVVGALLVAWWWSSRRDATPQRAVTLSA